MTNNLTYQTNNAEFNPLFEKMQARFCQGGTVAEKLIKRANEHTKNTPKRVSKEFYMTYANSLPKKETTKRSSRNSCGKKLFSLHRACSACLALLVIGTICVSGAALEKMNRVDLLADLHKAQAPVFEFSIGTNSENAHEEITTIHDTDTTFFSF